MKLSKQVPSSANYNPIVKEKVPLGKQSKAECVDFLSEAEYLGLANPSPSSYSPNVHLLFLMLKKHFIMRRSSSYIYRKPTKEPKNDWKPRKVKEPDVGSYEVSKSVSLVKPRYP